MGAKERTSHDDDEDGSLLAQKPRIYIPTMDAVIEVHEEAVERLARAEVVQLRAYDARPRSA